MHHPRLLVPIDRSKFEHAQGQLAVAATASTVDQNVERAIHGFEVIVNSRARYLALVVPHLIDLHRREHALGIPRQVTALLEEVRFGDVWGVHKLVTRFLVTPAGVVLHGAANHAALGMKNGKPRAHFFRKTEQVKLHAQAAVIAFGRFLEACLVCAQFVFGGPSGSVNALQLGILLTTSPVRGCHPCERETVTDHACIGQVRPAAQIFPDRFTRGRIDVVIYGQLGSAHLDVLVVTARRLHNRTLEADEFEFVGLVGKFCTSLVFGYHAAHKTLTRTDNAFHGLLQLRELIRVKRIHHIKVVVEAVCDGWSDAKRGRGIDALHRLCQYVGGRVPQDAQTIGRVNHHGFDGVALGNACGKVAQLAVNAHGHNASV
ncbi:unannotated protein [freshwater metagenome]|uniref:Unannotated protein n=1 Tax=freshwater metagenome TaxID=449393 RepID=A0A6J7GG32_9ZZZZ